MSAARPARGRGVRAEVPITREAIVDAAFRMIDERGPEGFSMRSLASEMGVFPATLYWHVGDRAHLLGLVQQQWMDFVETPDDLDDWREWAVELGRRYRQNAHRYPNVARLVTVERARNIDALRVPDAVVGKLAQLGFGDQLVHAYNTLLGAVQGFVVMELSPISDAGENASAEAEQDMRNLDPERFPNISAHFDQLADHGLSVRWTDADQNPLDRSFEFMMQVLLDGLAARLPSTDG
ncbi:MAG: TetR/AcrR family transcriptional regulator C-terminal domain-containing protein [Ilumatobacter sp.]|nr:TetR/AcrR family transcriptional regulator C-terminal domain-containing protein [Ilumatobacter sp.]